MAASSGSERWRCGRCPLRVARGSVGRRSASLVLGITSARGTVPWARRVSELVDDEERLRFVR
jgi:hypothetical protein